jgi:pimeloyl-ACP methyl ester carboxylesterase
LRRYFWGRFGRTRPTIIAGDSQGGAITFRTIELYPEIYDGALPMCAVAEPALRFFKERVFDMRLQFDYTFPGLPGSVLEFPDGERTLANYARGRESGYSREGWGTSRVSSSSSRSPSGSGNGPAGYGPCWRTRTRPTAVTRVGKTLRTRSVRWSGSCTHVGYRRSSRTPAQRGSAPTRSAAPSPAPRPRPLRPPGRGC